MFMLVLTRVVLPAIACTTTIFVSILAALFIGLPGPVGIVVGVLLVVAIGATADHVA